MPTVIYKTTKIIMEIHYTFVYKLMFSNYDCITADS